MQYVSNPKDHVHTHTNTKPISTNKQIQQETGYKINIQN